MELRRYLGILRRRALLILLTGLLAAGVAYASADRTTVYTAQSTLYVGASRFNFNSGSNTNADQIAGVTQIIATFAKMIDSRPIAQDALELTGLPRSADAVLGEVQSTNVFGTSLLQITATDPDPRVAQTLANGMAEAFVNRIKTLEPGQVVGEGQVPVAPVSLFERAALPTVPETNSALPTVIVAGLFGLLFASACVLLLEYLDVTVKSVHEAEHRLELPVLAAIPVLDVRPVVASRRPTLVLDDDRSVARRA